MDSSSKRSTHPAWTYPAASNYNNSMQLVPRMMDDKISTSLVECERVEAKIGKALSADGSPCVWKKFPPARRQKGFLS